MSVDIGNRNRAMCFQCTHCDWRPGNHLRMGVVGAHFETEHPDAGDDPETGTAISLELIAPCTCGTKMDVVRTRPTGGGTKDYLLCPACGNTGSIYSTRK